MLEIAENAQNRKFFPVYAEYIRTAVYPIILVFYFVYLFFKRMKSIWLHGKLVKCKKRQRSQATAHVLSGVRRWVCLMSGEMIAAVTPKHVKTKDEEEEESK